MASGSNFGVYIRQGRRVQQPGGACDNVQPAICYYRRRPIAELRAVELYSCRWLEVD